MKTAAKNHVEAWKTSGLKQREYARQNGINPNTFVYWIHRERELAQNPRAGFLEIRPSAEVRKSFFPESLPESKSDLQISVNLGFIRLTYRRSS